MYTARPRQQRSTNLERPCLARKEEKSPQNQMLIDRTLEKSQRKAEQAFIPFEDANKRSRARHKVYQLVLSRQVAAPAQRTMQDYEQGQINNTNRLSERHIGRLDAQNTKGKSSWFQHHG